MKRILLILSLLIVVGASALFAAYRVAITQYWRAPAGITEPVELVIERGASAQTIATQLETGGVIRHALLFRVLAQRFGQAARFQAGEYRFTPDMTPRDISRLMAKGETLVRQVTIPEGWVNSQIAEVLRGEAMLSGEVTLAAQEGGYLPDTYRFTRGQSRQSVLERMQRAMDDTLHQLWEARSDNLPLASAREALILASIVEKETGIASERPQVAAVFVNRLRAGMRLQSDPTVNYGLYRETGTLKTRLMRADLAHVSPYNTYVIDGLPPEPICNPGRASLEAVLHPPATDALYFVADGKGGHVFSTTLKEHNRNVRAYHRMLRDQR